LLETFSSSQIGRRSFVCNWVRETKNPHPKPKGEKKGNSLTEKKREQLECLTSFSNRRAEVGSFWKGRPPTSTCYVCFLTCRMFLHNIYLYKLFLSSHLPHRTRLSKHSVKSSHLLSLRLKIMFFLFWY